MLTGLEMIFSLIDKKKYENFISILVGTMIRVLHKIHIFIHTLPIFKFPMSPCI